MDRCPNHNILVSVLVTSRRAVVHVPAGVTAKIRAPRKYARNISPPLACLPTLRHITTAGATPLGSHRHELEPTSTNKVHVNCAWIKGCISPKYSGNEKQSSENSHKLCVLILQNFIEILLYNLHRKVRLK
jgi:hypothetical protein